MKIAVASQDGKSVDTHFGHARAFRIYQVIGETCTLIESRDVDQYCVGGQSNSAGIGGILDTVSDCQAVLVAMIGDGPRKMLAASGIRAVADFANQPIENALRQTVRDLGAQ